MAFSTLCFLTPYPVTPCQSRKSSRGVFYSKAIRNAGRSIVAGAGHRDGVGVTCGAVGGATGGGGVEGDWARTRAAGKSDDATAVLEGTETATYASDNEADDPPGIYREAIEGAGSTLRDATETATAPRTTCSSSPPSPSYLRPESAPGTRTRRPISALPVTRRLLRPSTAGVCPSAAETVPSLRPSSAMMNITGYSRRPPSAATKRSPSAGLSRIASAPGTLRRVEPGRLNRPASGPASGGLGKRPVQPHALLVPKGVPAQEGRAHMTEGWEVNPPASLLMRSIPHSRPSPDSLFTVRERVVSVEMDYPTFGVLPGGQL